MRETRTGQHDAARQFLKNRQIPIDNWSLTQVLGDEVLCWENRNMVYSSYPQFLSILNSEDTA